MRVFNISLIFLEIRRGLLQDPKQKKPGNSTGLFGSPAFKGQYSLITYVKLRKMNNKLNIFILFCMSIMFLMTSCDNSEMKSSVSSGDIPILPRGNSQDCPDDDVCCCSVELDDTQSAGIRICGAEDATTFCAGTHSGCGIVPFNNLGFDFTLSTGSPIENFCMEEGSGFYVLNLGNQTTVDITCQRGQGNPQTVNVPLAANERVYFTVNTSCEIITCD